MVVMVVMVVVVVVVVIVKLRTRNFLIQTSFDQMLLGSNESSTAMEHLYISRGSRIKMLNLSLACQITSRCKLLLRDSHNEKNGTSVGGGGIHSRC